MNERDGEIKGGAGSRAVQVLIALGKSVCYLALFLGMQVLVVLPVAVAAGVQSALGNWETAEQLYSVLYESATALTAVSGLFTIAAGFPFFPLPRGEKGGSPLGPPGARHAGEARLNSAISSL